jgi:hypothetical protein
VATPDRMPQPQPCRNQDALCETPRSAPLGAGLQSASCGDPDPRCDPKRLHSSWHTMYRRRRLSPSGERGSSISGRFVQQCRYALSSSLCILWVLIVLFADTSEQKMLFIGIALINLIILFKNQFGLKRTANNHSENGEPSRYTIEPYLFYKMNKVVVFSTCIFILGLACRIYIL